MLCAPTGYPPSNPSNRIASPPCGTPVSLVIGLRRGIDTPFKDFVNICEMIKKGNSDGITVLMHKSTPLVAAVIAVLLSIIRINNDIAEMIPIMTCFLLFMHSPHKEFMHSCEKHNKYVIG